MEERNSLNSGINEELYDFESEVEEKETTDKPVRKDVDFEIIEAESIAATMEEDDEEVEEELENSVVPLEPYEPRKDLSAYQFPIPELLKDYTSISVNEDIKLAELRENKERIESTLNSFKIEITKITAIIGPTVTLYEIVPAEGIRISKIKNLENDIALNLAALGIRIIAPIPGKGTIGIEVPNKTPNIVSMKEIIVSEKFQSNKFELPIGLGKTISNEPFVVDLVKMPHLLMAGATGQGKSVGLNAIITSLLYKKHPSELKLVLIDPKKVEFPLYSNIEKHFLAKLPDEEEPIITDTKKVIRTLNSLCIEMDNRYELLKLAKVRNIKEYNTKFCRRELSPTNGHRYLPYIVLIIDEFGDLIMTAGREVEHPLARLAQLARAIGIHLIIATQRPSVKIISGNIKANFPARVAFRVSSRIDSQTILDTTGADQLVGKGDMLLSTGSDLLRLQCAFVDTPEVESVTNYIAEQQSYPEAYMLPEYADSDDSFDSDDSLSSDKLDPCFMDAATLIVQNQQGSTSLIQRRMNLGYNRAGRIMDQLEEFGIVGPPNGSKARDVKVQTLEELRIIFDKIGLL
jgi:S-DNA-T family DNA segregation ATPase FtsK/SpoIIIE